MGQEGSVAPKERVNIVYRPATGDQQAQVELPLKTLVLGDFTLTDDPTPLEARKPVNVDKMNFNEVLEAYNVSMSLTVADKLSGTEDPEATITADLLIKTLNDFSPDSIVEQVPQLKKLMELRSALIALKGPMGNVPSFRKKIQEIVADSSVRDNLLKELQIPAEA